MLAALLLNLGGTTPPIPPSAAVQRFGGGPFWRRRWEDDDEEEERESDVIAIELTPVAHAQVERAVRAIQSAPEPGRVVLDAGEVYARALRALDSDLDATRIERQWEREVRRKLRQAEREAAEEEEMIVIALLTH